ncbi:MAG: hypothetical protein IPJ65_00230 [Archangiaceae bacterium]|nr:hypothetical protein [Archangiaceae bacterium]
MLSLIIIALSATPDAGTRPLPSAQQPAFLDVPQALKRADVPPGMKALGVPVKLSAVVSKLNVEDLKDHYERAFIKAGLFVPTDDELDSPTSLEQVTGYDAKSRTSYSVIFQPNLDGTTTVMVGMAALHARMPDPPPFAPVFPGATGVLVSDAEAGHTLSYSVAAKPDEVRAFYRDVFTRAGLKSTADGRWEDPASGHWLQVRVNDHKGKSGVVVTGSTPGAE